METRSVDKQVNMISDRKVEREGHSTENVADALFMFTLDSRFLRRG